jgi:high-affinity nickel permease
VSFEILYRPVEQLDTWLVGLFAGAPLYAALAVAALLGLRHASDPDHLVAVTSIVAARDGDVRAGMRVGAWWGLGHGAMLIAVGTPLILLRSELPDWLADGAERAIGVVIVVLALRTLWTWLRGGYRSSPHGHGEQVHRHLYERSPAAHRHEASTQSARTPAQALSLGLLHGLGGSGAVALLLIARMPSQATALVGLALYAPMTMASMTACTGAWSWMLTRRLIQPLYRRVLIPGFALYGVLFGLWYAGVT